jgi:hypothetical protein
MVGYEDDPNNFYLKGEVIGNDPKISCRIFDSKGQFLFSIEKNSISYPTKKGIHFESAANKLVVYDDEDHIFLQIETRDEAGKLVTYIEGQFFDKNGRLAARGDERGLLVNCPLRM